MTYSGRTLATTGLKKQLPKNLVLGNITSRGPLWGGLLLGGVGGLGNWVDESSVNEEGEERFLSKPFPTSS